MLSINTNISSLITQHSMSSATDKLNLAIERMSTGFKINHAKDNAANYSISTNMTTKIGAYEVAEDNASMGLDMLTTAQDNIAQMQTHAERLRTLAIQARNGTYGAKSLDAIQTEANAICNEIYRLYSTAQYNGVSLFNQTEFDIPDYLPKADPITGFIENPYDYTEEELKNIESISKVTDSFVESTYKIETVEDLVKLAELTNNGVNTTGKTFILVKNLDLKEYCEANIANGGWIPIGNSASRFKGTFNGNGCIISNLTINRPSEEQQGLFGYTDIALIENVRIEDVSMTGHRAIAPLVGFARISNIKNCSTEGYIRCYNSQAAGIVGCQEGGKILNSTSEIKIEQTGSGVAGGITGYIYAGGTIESCYTNVDINATAAGGIVGTLDSQNIKNCYAIGNITGMQQGGIVGQGFYYSNMNIENCISFCNLSSSTNMAANIIGRIMDIPVDPTANQLTLNGTKSIDTGYNNIGYLHGPGAGNLDTLPLEEIVEIIDKKDTNTILQIGTKNDSSSQISMNTNFEYNLGTVIRKGVGSDSALNSIDTFISQLSKKETELGAVSNRLESVLEEITIQRDNLVSSRSTIRDADIANVSSQYIQQQILQQASATLLATANQSPSIALQLI